jgi:hypothetical protein
MLNLLKVIVLLPFYLIGWVVGFCYRPMVRGFYGGWFNIEAKANEAICEELEQELKVYQGDDNEN